jgi:hypothetical protein
MREKAKKKKKRQIKMYTRVRWNIYVSTFFFLHVQSSTTTDERKIEEVEEEEKNTIYI